MSKQINRDILNFVKKIEPEFAALIHEKIMESQNNGDTMDISQLQLDVTKKMQEWCNLGVNQLDTQLEIEVITSLSARLMLLWYALDKTIPKNRIAVTDAIGG